MAVQARGYKASTTIDFESAYNRAPVTKKGILLPINKNEMEKLPGAVITRFPVWAA